MTKQEDGGAAQGCMTCSLAQWTTTTGGRLHPSGDGRCMWECVPQPIPKSRYWIGNPPRPHGGIISRRKPEIDCPCFVASALLTHRRKTAKQE